MNKRFLALAGVAAVLSVGTYVGLNIVKPYKHEEPKVADVTSPDQVFGASVANPEAHADEAGATPAPAAAAPTDVAAVQPADTSVQPAGTAPAPTAEEPAAPAAAAPAASGSGSVAPLVPAGSAGATPAASTETAAAAAPEPTPAPAVEPAPAPEPVAEAPAAPAPKPKKATHSASSGKSSKSSSAKVWWPAEKDDKLSLVYAGPASFKKAVVLMFNGAFFKDDGISSNIKVTDKSGKAVSGKWELGENNRRMLVFPVSGAGSYKVSIASGLTDSKGRKLGTKLSGPVVVK